MKTVWWSSDDLMDFEIQGRGGFKLNKEQKLLSSSDGTARLHRNLPWHFNLYRRVLKEVSFTNIYLWSWPSQQIIKGLRKFLSLQMVIIHIKVEGTRTGNPPMKKTELLYYIKQWHWSSSSNRDRESCFRSDLFQCHCGLRNKSTQHPSEDSLSVLENLSLLKGS